MRTETCKEESLLGELTRKPTLVENIEQRLLQDDRLGINIGIIEGLLLKSLCSQEHVEKVVEIGTQYGCSAAWMAMGLGEGGKLYCFEKDEAVATQAKQTFLSSEFQKLGCSVELFTGEALNQLSQIEPHGPFDLIFIDANKSGYLDYFTWAKEHIRGGGLIVADNIFLFGSQFASTCPEGTPQKMWQVMRETLKDAFSDTNFHSSIVPTQEGLLISTKKSP